MADYSGIDKFLHKFYLSNYALSKATLEMDDILYGAKTKGFGVSQLVFVTGLARSGTTAVMRKIHDSGSYASLQYSNMPFLLCPNIWNRSVKLEAQERAHNDGIIIDANSPEEFDEYFWKVFLKDSYIRGEALEVHEVDKEILQKYLNYINLICLSKEKHRYISKNNNNILRLHALSALENSKVIMLFRDPVTHASSLKKLHEKFSLTQKEDPFSLAYFNFLGHHEFGLNHKPFMLTKDFRDSMGKYDIHTLNYWLAVWLNYYRYVLEQIDQIDILLRFEDLIENPDPVYSFLWKELHLEGSVAAGKKHHPDSYSDGGNDKMLLLQCKETYQQLCELRRY